MKRILVINPNTSPAVTQTVLNACRNVSGEVAWEGVTARFGAPYIASEVAYALASHSVLDAYACHYAGHDAVLIACFGDPGLLALQEISPVPVVSLAQAGFMAAAELGSFAVVTGGSAWGPMLHRFARTHALDKDLVGIHTVELNGAQIAADPARAMQDLLGACQLGLRAGARSILLGGAALAGLAAELQSQLGVPVLDNVVLGAQATLHASANPLLRVPTSASYRLPGVIGVSAELQAFLTS